jgi:hypothetical protein
MSHGGNYSNSDWNDGRYQTAQSSNSRRTAPFSGSAYDEISEPDYDEAPAIASGARYGRPSRSDLQTEFDYDQRPHQPQLYNRVQSNSSYQNQGAASLQSNLVGRHVTTDRFTEGRITEAHSNLNHEWDDDFENYSSHVNDRITNEISNNSTTRDNSGFPSDTNYTSYSASRSSNSQAGTFSSQPSGGAVAAFPPPSSRPSSLTRELPPKKEAIPILPPSLPVEPPAPQSRVNRRYLQYTRIPRQPNRTVAKKVKNARLKPGEEEMQVLKCPNCQSFLKVLKMAVFMECPTCSAVSPATSSSGNGIGSGSGIGIGVGISVNSLR